MPVTLVRIMFCSVVVMVCSQEPEWRNDGTPEKYQEKFETLVSFATELIHDDFRTGHVNERTSRDAQQDGVEELASLGQLHANNDPDWCRCGEQRNEHNYLSESVPWVGKGATQRNRSSRFVNYDANS